MKTVSVIIAAYRAAAFIHDAIRSVLIQQLPPDYQLQLILGIDGCKATRQAVSGIEDNRVQVLNMEKNYGTYITFNTMIRFAIGRLIVRFDADDLMLEGYLSKQIEVFEQHPEVYLTWTRNRYINKEGHTIQDMPKYNDRNLKYWEIRSPSNGQFMIRKALWDALGGFQPWRCNSDTDFLIRMRYFGYREYGIPEILYLRRIHPDSLTQSAETGYNSALRKSIVEIMNRATSERTSREECRIEPIVGRIANSVTKLD